MPNSSENNAQNNGSIPLNWLMFQILCTLMELIDRRHGMLGERHEDALGHILVVDPDLDSLPADSNTEEEEEGATPTSSPPLPTTNVNPANAVGIGASPASAVVNATTGGQPATSAVVVGNPAPAMVAGPVPTNATAIVAPVLAPPIPAHAMVAGPVPTNATAIVAPVLAPAIVAGSAPTTATAATAATPAAAIPAATPAAAIAPAPAPAPAGNPAPANAGPAPAAAPVAIAAAGAGVIAPPAPAPAGNPVPANAGPAPAALGAATPAIVATTATPIPGTHSIAGTLVPHPDEACFLAPGADRFYVVTKGRRVGIFGGWANTSPYVTGIGGAVYMRYPTRTTAQDAYTSAYLGGLVSYI